MSPLAMPLIADVNFLFFLEELENSSSKTPLSAEGSIKIKPLRYEKLDSC